MTSNTHYLPGDPETGRWGLRLHAGGSARIFPGGAYPALGHPGSHLFHWERGRILAEFQLILIAAGAGEYEDRDGHRRLFAGDAFLLVPGRWHRYRPDPLRGWTERWLAFSGPAVGRLYDEGRLDPRPTRRLDAGQRGRLDEILHLLDRRPPRWRAEAEALTASVLARFGDAEDLAVDDPLHTAARRLQADINLPIDTLAAETGLSPSQFRLRFRRLHGSSPRRYRQAVLLARARQLLSIPGTSVCSVANALGFSDHAHFTRAYRRAGGDAPSRWCAATAAIANNAPPSPRTSARRQSHTPEQ
jgi:AraC-like DNA-binding protein